jgi:hypothetical protein
MYLVGAGLYSKKLETARLSTLRLFQQQRNVKVQLLISDHSLDLRGQPVQTLAEKDRLQTITRSFAKIKEEVELARLGWRQSTANERRRYLVGNRKETRHHRHQVCKFLFAKIKEERSNSPFINAYVSSKKIILRIS